MPTPAFAPVPVSDDTGSDVGTCEGSTVALELRENPNAQPTEIASIVFTKYTFVSSGPTPYSESR
jgi:hypothetical protein